MRENGDKSIVRAAVERRKRLSAQNNRAEGSAIAVALQTVTLAPPVPSERPAQLSWINLGPQIGVSRRTHFGGLQRMAGCERPQPTARIAQRVAGSTLSHPPLWGGDQGGDPKKQVNLPRAIPDRSLQPHRGRDTFEPSRRRSLVTMLRNALVAQWIEHRSSEPRVGGSNPSECTRFKSRRTLDLAYLSASGSAA